MRRVAGLFIVRHQANCVATNYVFVRITQLCVCVVYLIKFLQFIEVLLYADMGMLSNVKE
jgi:hypothetical protein